MDFAKKILGKYGWKEGDGLGKNNTGIVAPLKASLKFDNAGLGVDRAKEFNDHWWERCFNEAASNVTVKVAQNGEVSAARKAGEEAVEISTKGYSAKKLKKAKAQQRNEGAGAVYEHFLKSALLTQDGGEVASTERIKVDDIAVTKVNVLTDEELFKACGGRTAHKGARHGLKLSGKLARVEQQEREMLAKLLATKNVPETQEIQPEKIKKKKRKKDHDESQTKQISESGNVQATKCEPETQEAEPDQIKKKKRKGDKLEKTNDEQEQTDKPESKSKKHESKQSRRDEAEAPVRSKKKEA